MSTPAGWFPDPNDQSQSRYWDGTQWTDQRRPNPAGAHEAPPPPAPSGGAAGSGGFFGWVKRHKILTAVIVIVLLVIIGTASGGGSDDDQQATSNQVAPSSPPPASPSEESTPSPKPSKAAPPTKKAEGGEYGSYPNDEAAFVAAVVKARDEADDADNDLQKGAALSKRNKAVCDLLGDRRVKGWTGKVQHIDANGEGKGVLQIEIADEVMVNTWNNAFSDIQDHTLIEPGPLFDSVLELSEGDKVSFSGQFMKGTDACVNDSALTLNGSVTSPDFIFKFDSVEKG